FVPILALFEEPADLGQDVLRRLEVAGKELDISGDRTGEDDGSRLLAELFVERDATRDLVACLVEASAHRLQASHEDSHVGLAGSASARVREESSATRNRAWRRFPPVVQRRGDLPDAGGSRPTVPPVMDERSLGCLEPLPMPTEDPALC